MHTIKKVADSKKVSWRKLCSLLGEGDSETFVGMHCIIHKGWPFRLRREGGLEYFDSRKNEWVKY
jgi:hypothetical protein